MKRRKKEDGTIDFTTKRLGLVHNPRIHHTVDDNASFNEKAEALVEFKNSFIPKEVRR